jgi:excisionase family DNA binding protein
MSINDRKRGGVEDHLSLAEAAEHMGISERTARRWIKSGKLRAYKPGRDYWIPESALTELVEESKVSPKGLAPSPEPSLFNGLEDERQKALEILFDNLRLRITSTADRWIRSAETGFMFWSEDAAIAYSIELNNEAAQLFSFVSEALEPALKTLFAGTLTLRSEQRKLIQAVEHLNKAVELANKAADAVAPPKEPTEEDWAAFAEIAEKLWEEMDEVEQRRILREVAEEMAAECEQAAEDLRGRIA